MADTKVSALTEDTGPTTDDLIYTIQDPGGTPLSRKATLDNVAKSGSLGNLLIRTDITSLTGGGATALDSIVTTGLTVATTVAMILNSNVIEYWNLVSGTDAEDTAGGIVRPDDYATTTNEKVWKQAG